MTYRYSSTPSFLRRSFRDNPRRSLWRWLTTAMLALVLTTQSAFAQNSVGMVKVQTKRMTPQLNAYAQVEPTSVLPLNAAETGVVSGLSVAPGMHVRAGQVLAELSGPSIQNLLLQDKANLRSAKAQFDDAQKSLAIQEDQLRIHLSTREMVHQAQSTFSKAQAGLKNAEAQLSAVERMRTVTAPTGGVVLSLSSRNGQLVQAGQPLVTLQSDGSLWLVATYYGNDLRAIRAGMTGQFTPSDSSGVIPVQVAALFASITPGGGEQVALQPTRGHAAWINGESGTVVLHAQSRILPVVPTRALILDQGKWWVMIRNAKGYRAQQVVPGPSQGWNTFIKSGLAPGAKVVTTNAYLLFHSEISEHYQIPD